MKSSLIFSSQPQSIALGDLNNDDQLDIIVANSGTNKIGIFFAKGNGMFEEQITYPTGFESYPRCISIGDFNNDNYVDIAVANYGTNNIGIFLGKGNKTFDNQNIISLGSSHPSFITIGDMNNDEQMDIIVANNGTNSIGILLGYGNGSFQDLINYSTGYDSIPSSVTIEDLNHDHYLDIVVTNYGTNNIGIFFGYGNGTFTNQIIYTTTLNSNPSSVVVTDINNDTILDIIVTNYGLGNLGIFIGQGNGSFFEQIIYSIDKNSHPQYITVNGLTFVVADPQNDYVHIFSDYKNGSFVNIATYDTISGSSPYAIAVTDFNHNNQLDMIVTNYGENNVLVLIDYSITPSARQVNNHFAPLTSARSVAVNDFNNDHIVDIVFNIGNNITILTGLGNGSFSKEFIYSIDVGTSVIYICVADLNNDTKMDIVTANLGLDSVGIMLGYGNGSLTNMTNYSTDIHSSPWNIALDDLNNDNRLDIVSANMGTNTIGFFLGNGDGTFGIMIKDAIDIFDYTPYAVGIYDINNDTYLDIVIVTGNTYILIYFGQGNITFILSDILITGFGSNSIAFGDFNDDTHVDFVIANTFSGNIGVFIGYDNGTFTDQISYSTGLDSQPYYAIVADFNNDNISDIIVTSFGTDNVVIFYGNGKGNFTLTRNYSTGYGSKPYGIVAADLTNDKKLELIVALWGTADIAILTAYYAAEFINQTIYSTGSASLPTSVAINDFNNDNRSDLVVANFGIDNLSILLGLPNGTFDIEIMYSIEIGVHSRYVSTCDINKDNYADIVSVNSENDTISMILGYGNGTFHEQIIYSTGDGSHPYAVGFSDFNNDSWLDLAVVNEGTDSIGIFFAYNYTSFQDQMIFSNNDGSAPEGIVIGDFNNDNNLDIVAAFFNSNNIGILLGCPNGSFSNMMIFSTGIGLQPCAIGVGDFNHDNRLDIVVTNCGDNTIEILLGYGDGNFSLTQIYSIGNISFIVGINVSDINYDNQLDIIITNYYGNFVGVLLGYGNGSFSIMNTYSTGDDSLPQALSIMDVDNDDQLDIIVANFNTDNVGLFFGYGNGTFQSQLTYSTGFRSGPSAVASGDFNHDNKIDIAVSLQNKNNVGILLSKGNRTFADMTTYSPGYGSVPIWISVGDFNNDNNLDIAVANYGTNNIVILFGFGDGTFLLGTAYSTGVGSGPFMLAINDFNKDNRLDITVANSVTNNIGIFYGYDNEHFAGMTTYTTGEGSHPHALTINDLNKDGWFDIVTANYGTNNVGILFGNIDGTFHQMIIYRTGNNSAPSCVATADLNNDTHLDIVVTNTQTDSIIIFFGYGNGTFGNDTIYYTDIRSLPYTIFISDLNNDNILDITITNFGNSNIFFLYGYGDGKFRNGTSYSLGYGYHPDSIVVKDLNQDNSMDIIIACYNTDHVETLISIC